MRHVKKTVEANVKSDIADVYDVLKIAMARTWIYRSADNPAPQGVLVSLCTV